MIAGSFDSDKNFQFNTRGIKEITSLVPEPSEYAMMVLGLAIIAFCVRKRRL